MDAFDKEFAFTAFTAGLGFQSKDLLFSITKNSQASMAEVLAKAQKYINCEETFLSKVGNSSTQGEKEKRIDQSPREDRT